jgi:hypothetical protein
MPVPIKSYLLPAVITAAIISLVFVAGEIVGSHRNRLSPVPTHQEEWEPDSGSSPYRFLTVLIERDAFYIGDERVSFDDLRAVLRERAKELKANGVAIYGTTSSHFGPAVAALDSARVLHFTRISTECTPVADGTRLEAIQLRRDWYSAVEEKSPNQPPLRMPVSGTPAADAPVAPPPGIAGR